MDLRTCPLGELQALLHSGLAHEELAGQLVVLEPDGGPSPTGEDVVSIPAVFAAFEPFDAVDVWLPHPGALDVLAPAVSAAPLASVALALLLRTTAGQPAETGLVAESTVYSMLQGGPEFAAWQRTYSPRPRLSEIGPAVVVDRAGSTLQLTLSRPHLHNAFSRRMRDELADALTLASLDDSVTAVELRGAGPSFCSGGDLAEFGSFPDPASAHVTRLSRSPARLMATVGPRVTAFLHGAAMGAGIELPAFAARVVAAPDTVIALPELSLGLIPGAGGTVSLPGRIGRQRTAWLALTGERLDAATALAWGLVDEIADEPGETRGPAARA